jgi:hypothetical protein
MYAGFFCVQIGRSLNLSHPAMTRLLALASIRTRLGARGIARGGAGKASITKRASMCMSMCTCIGCLEGCRPDTALRPGFAERS